MTDLRRAALLSASAMLLAIPVALETTAPTLLAALASAPLLAAGMVLAIRFVLRGGSPGDPAQARASVASKEGAEARGAR